MPEVVEHYLLRLARGDGEGGNEHSTESAEGVDSATGWRITLRSIKDGTMADFTEPAELLEYLDIKENG